jgi:ribosomal protein S18 acetylase RimI-like enzyme
VKIEIRPADNIIEAEALSEIDRKIYLPSDCFDDPELWKDYECFWIVVDDIIAGSIAIGLNLEFSGSWDEDKPCPGCIYLAGTGLLPEFQRKGIGDIVKQWEIDYAKSHGFQRISTHCRKSNLGSLRLNQKFGFQIIGEFADYYEDPDEATTVMELIL